MLLISTNTRRYILRMRTQGWALGYTVRESWKRFSDKADEPKVCQLGLPVNQAGRCRIIYAHLSLPVGPIYRKRRVLCELYASLPCDDSR